MKSVCRLLAFMVLKRRSLPSSVFKNPCKVLIIVIIRDMSSAMTMMAEIPAPTQMIMTGPSAILGRELSMTKCGSSIFLAVSHHQSAMAASMPSAVASRNASSVSARVTPM